MANLETEISRYFQNCAIGFRCNRQGESILTFYVRDPETHIYGNFRQGKILIEAIYRKEVVDYIKVYQLPRQSFQKMAADVMPLLLNYHENGQ